MVKKILQLAGISFLLVFGIGGFLTSCQNPATPGVENDDNNQQNGEETVKSGSVLSFGMDSLAGLAITSAGSPYRSVARAVGGYSESLLKIKESGDIEKFISFPEGTRVELSNVSYVVQSPVEGSKDFYIVFGSDSYWYEIYTETNEWGGSWQNEKQHVIGQLLYVTEDGAYYDILKNDDSIGSNLCCSSSWNGGYEDRDYSTTLQFDSEGNLYYLVSEYEKTGSSKDMIYKFDPKTKKSTNLVAAISNTSYSEFYVSSAGDWVFVQGSRSSTSNSYFLRAIPTDNPTKTVDIYYSNSSYVEDWIYDEESRNVYYLQGNALYRSSYVGGTYTEDSQVIAAAADSYKESFSYESLLDHNWRYKYNYRITGTNKPAYKEEIEWSYLSELVLAGKALYCIEKNWDSTSKLVQLTDNDGNAVCEYVDFGEQQLLQFSSFEVYDNCFYFKNEILKASGEQSGKQTILRFDPVTATLEEMLYYMSNNTDYEIVSYDVSGSYLYCCFVNGTEIFIGRINVSDKSYKKFTANTDTELRKIMMLE